MNKCIQLQRVKEYLRPEVLWFACEMEKRLRKNDYKGGWWECDFPYLFECMWHEYKELMNCFDRTDTGERVPIKSVEVICGEAADIANFAMMIADNARRIAERLRQKGGDNVDTRTI